MQRALKNMSLASVEVGKHLVVMNRQFDATIGGGNEPGIAFMVLFNLESGVFLGSVQQFGLISFCVSVLQFAGTIELSGGQFDCSSEIF